MLSSLRTVVAVVLLILCGDVGQRPHMAAQAARLVPENPPSLLRAAVCVVGQVGRLELESKIANILKPNRRLVTVEWFLLLRSGEPHYTNTAPKQKCSAAPGSLQEAASQISAHNATVVAIERPRRVHQLNTSIWPAYQASQTATLQVRMQKNFEQLLSWRDCADAVEQAEQRNGAQYHVVLRVRDNSLILRPFHLEQPLRSLMLASVAKGKRGHVTSRKKEISMLSSLPVMAKACSAWGGYADKTMLIPRQHMGSALRGPADHFQSSSARGRGWREVRNTETYLKYVLDMLDVPVVAQEDPALMPVTDGRCESGDTFCFVNNSKDCRPQPVSGVKYQECKLSYLSKRVG
mmetsp:Transcript_23324/g.58543  ORF Transcript_23324/g.58543 Transcript_23324/m.58543 type:complete len:350 (+) Transcript_23324:255-1304(+)